MHYTELVLNLLAFGALFSYLHPFHLTRCYVLYRGLQKVLYIYIYIYIYI